MDFLQPTSWAEALEAKAAHPDAVPVAGGTDVMVGINFGHLRPSLGGERNRPSDNQRARNLNFCPNRRYYSESTGRRDD